MRIKIAQPSDMPCAMMDRRGKSGELKRVNVDYSKDFTAAKFQMSGMQLFDVDADGSDEVFLQSFSDAPMYLKYNTTTQVFDLHKVNKAAYKLPKSGKGRAIVISTSADKPCYKVVSAEDWNRSRKHEISISKSCIK